MPDTLQSEAQAIILIFPILSTLVLALRCYSRFLSRQFGWDDILIIIAWLFSVGQTYTVWMYTILSYQGYHIWDVPPQTTAQQITAQQYNLANQLLYNPILAIVKASVIVFLFRLEDHRPLVRWNLHALFWVNLALMISIFLADLLQCTPLHYVYDYPAMDLAAQQAAGADENGIQDGQLVKGGKCFDQIGFFLGSGGLTILTDVWMLCIPTIIVWRLQMNRRKKIAIIGILSMGVIVTIIGIARLIIYANRFRPDNPDRTYNIGHTISGVEVNVAIITASAIALHSFLNRVAPRFLSNTDHSSEQRRSQQQHHLVGHWGVGSKGDRSSGASNGRRGRGRKASYVMMGDITLKDTISDSQENIVPSGGDRGDRLD